MNAARLFDLSGRTALVTGSSRGIGLALAEGLAGAGAVVILNGRHADAVEEAAAGLRAEGAEVLVSVFDVADEAAFGRMREAALAEFAGFGCAPGTVEWEHYLEMRYRGQGFELLAPLDLARLAGLNPAGVICEIMNDDGTMARRDDLIAFAQRHGLKIATIADLIAYRRRHDRVVERRLTETLESRYGGTFQTAIYVDKTTDVEHIALWKGELSSAGPVLVRVHVLDVLDDALGERTSGKAGELEQVMRLIDEVGRGVLVVIREPTPTSLSDGIKARLGEQEKPFGELRDYGVGAQILLDLGVTDMILLSNTKRTIVGLDGYGLKVVEQRPIPVSGD